MQRATAAIGFKPRLYAAMAHRDVSGPGADQLGQAMDGKNGVRQITRRLSFQIVGPRMVHSLGQYPAVELCDQPDFEVSIITQTRFKTFVLQFAFVDSL